MNDRDIAKFVGAGRVLFGAACLAAPGVVFSQTGDSPEGAGRWMIRAFGIRDMVLGAGALMTLSKPDADVLWVQLGATADTADALTAIAFKKELGNAGLAATLSLAIPAAALGWKSAAGISAERF